MTRVLEQYIKQNRETPTFEGKLGKATRRLTVFDLHLKGWAPEKIAQYLNIKKSIVQADIRASYTVAREEIVDNTINHLAKFIAQQEQIIATGYEMLERITALESMWVDKVFGDPVENEIVEDGPPEEDEYGRYRKKKKVTIDYGRVQIKTDRASILSEISKASLNIAKAKGLLTEKIAISIDMMNDDQLLKEAEKYGIDLVALGIKKADILPVQEPKLLNPVSKYDDMIKRMENKYDTLEGELIDETVTE